MNRTDRLMGIVLELQARGERRAEDLARTFEVSVRTVYRDVQALSEAGVPVVATPGKGYRVMEGYFLPPVRFTAPEAALLLLGGAFVRDRVDADLQRAGDNALRKLAGVLPPEQRAEVERRRHELLFSSARPTEVERRLSQIRGSIEERRVLHLLYHAYRRAAPEPRDVEPVRLVYLAEAWHLAAYCRVRRAARLFRLDRIDDLHVLDERFVLGERHAAADDRGEGWDRYPEARVRFDVAVERWARERRPYFCLREESGPGGAVFVYAMREERDVLAWLLSWGAAVEVLDPPELRARLAAEARALFMRHADAGDFPRLFDSRDAAAITVSGASP
jgi:predicted DNA-binding transcriptional regulator YafY